MTLLDEQVQILGLETAQVFSTKPYKDCRTPLRYVRNDTLFVTASYKRSSPITACNQSVQSKLSRSKFFN